VLSKRGYGLWFKVYGLRFIGYGLMVKVYGLLDG
jgi:hypothetical protein